MLDNLILHIGAEKTGTTTIQEFLALNRALLKEQGVIFPGSLGGKNHTRLALYAANESRGIWTQAKKNLAKESSPDAIRPKIRDEFDREWAQLSPGLRLDKTTLIFSAEHMHSQLQTQGEILRLKEMLPPAKSTTILFYVRRQDRAAISLYSTSLKAGSVNDLTLPHRKGGVLPYRYDYLRSYKLWSSVFGQDSMNVRIFNRADFVNGSLIEDFLTGAGIDWQSEFVTPPNKNSSLDANGIYVIRNLNRIAKAAGNEYSAADVRSLRSSLSSKFTGKSKFMPPRDSAIAFYEQFQAGNAELRKLAFPGRTELFDDDFSEYPPEALSDLEVVDHELVCNALLKAWLELAKQRHTGKKT